MARLYVRRAGQEKEEALKRDMKMEFSSQSENEGFARVAVGAFIAPLNPTVDELADVKTAVSEAVTNAIIHGYDQNPGKIWITCEIEDDRIELCVIDVGRGIEDVEKAREPLYTTRPELERYGMGFTFMEAFMDEVWVTSAVGQGTRITMRKRIGKE